MSWVSSLGGNLFYHPWREGFGGAGEGRGAAGGAGDWKQVADIDLCFLEFGLPSHPLKEMKGLSRSKGGCRREWVKEGWSSEQWQVRVGLGRKDGFVYRGTVYLQAQSKKVLEGVGNRGQRGKECKQCWECQLSPGKWEQWRTALDF